MAIRAAGPLPSALRYLSSLTVERLARSASECPIVKTSGVHLERTGVHDVHKLMVVACGFLCACTLPRPLRLIRRRVTSASTEATTASVLYPVSVGDKWATSTRPARWSSTTAVRHAWDFSEGLAVVQPKLTANGLHRQDRRDGHRATVRRCMGLLGGSRRVWQEPDGKAGYIDKTGAMVIERGSTSHSLLRRPRNGQVGEEFGFIDTTGPMSWRRSSGPPFPSKKGCPVLKAAGEKWASSTNRAPG